MGAERNAYLLVLGERRAIAWVLREQRMAFPATRNPAQTLTPGDDLYLYTTRSAYRNPTRDRGRVIGRALVTSRVIPLDPPVEIAGRTYPVGCDLRIEDLAPWGVGVELGPMADRLAVFPKPAAWSAYLRRTLVPLPGTDARTIRDLLRPLAGSRADHLAGYEETAAVRAAT